MICLAAAAGAFGATALLSAATARADDFTEIVDNVQSSLATGQDEFSQAFTDFSSGVSGVPDGLEAFVNGVNDDLVGTDEDVLIGETEALSNGPISGYAYFATISPPSDLTDALTLVDSVEAGDQGDLATIASQFAMGEYADAVLNYFNYSFDTSIFPADQILIGGIDQLLGF